MPSYGNQIAPRDQTQHTSLSFGTGEPLEIDFYINRLTGETIPLQLNGRAEEMTDAELTNYRNATELSQIIAGWNLTGPVQNATGETLVADYEAVPLDPDILAHTTLQFRNAVTMHLLGIAFPNRPTSVAPRRR